MTQFKAMPEIFTDLDEAAVVAKFKSEFNDSQ